MQRVLIIGATSAIAEAAARVLAERGDALFLAARNTGHLARIASDLATRGAARVEQASFNATRLEAFETLLDEAFDALDGIDIALIAHGSGSHEASCLRSLDELRREFDINATSTLALMAQLGLRMKAQGYGSIAVISSVAGDRGRAANLLYGSAKAAVSAYASGLRQRLAGSGVNVLTIKPGWIDTPMTANLRKSALFATPGRIAPAIVRAIDKRRAVVYLPWFWRPIMLALRAIPESIWKRLSL